MEHVPGVEMGDDVKQQRLALNLIDLYNCCSGSRETVIITSTKKGLDRWNKSRSGDDHVNMHQNTK